MTLSIGAKLTIFAGIVAASTVVVVALSILDTAPVTDKITVADRTTSFVAELSGSAMGIAASTVFVVRLEIGANGAAEGFSRFATKGQTGGTNTDVSVRTDIATFATVFPVCDDADAFVSTAVRCIFGTGVGTLSADTKLVNGSAGFVAGATMLSVCAQINTGRSTGRQAFFAATFSATAGKAIGAGVVALSTVLIIVLCIDTAFAAFFSSWAAGRNTTSLFAGPAINTGFATLATVVGICGGVGTGSIADLLSRLARLLTLAINAGDSTGTRLIAGSTVSCVGVDIHTGVSAFDLGRDALQIDGSFTGTTGKKCKQDQEKQQTTKTYRVHSFT